jgi:ectoine hydroxylase-related dioxygenase (phytanoyl-CoA dioxygenase family)
MANDEIERLRSWEKDGFFIVRRAVRRKAVTELSVICDAVLQQVRDTSSTRGHTSTHVSGLLASEYFVGRPEALARLADYVTSRDVLTVIQGLGRTGEGLLNLRDVQYFHEPSTRDYDGAWHRDGATPGPNEFEAPVQPTLLRFRTALAHDDHLEYVPGSHTRPDTSEELTVLRGTRRNGPLASKSIRIELEPGDVCVFNVWGIHRARYRRDRIRRTLDLLFGFGPRKRIIFTDWRALAKRS